MKKKIALLVAGVMTVASAVAANANVTVNGTDIDADAVVVDGVVMVPYRAVMEGIGGTVAWDGETKTATVTDPNGEASLSVTVDSNVLTVSGYTAVMEAPAQIVDEKLYFPLSVVKLDSETLVDVDEDGNVVITTGDYVASAAAVDVVESPEAVEVDEETTEEETVEETTEVATVVANPELDGDEDVVYETVEETTEETTAATTVVRRGSRR
jgi:hypothetical protein